MNEFVLDSLWDYQDPAASEACFRERLNQTDAPEDQAEVLTQIARAQGLQRQFDEAHATLDDANGLAPEAATRAYARYLLERGRVINSAGDRATSRPYFLKAIKISQAAHEDFYAIDGYHMLGIVDPSDSQLKWSLKALAIAEDSDEPRAQNWTGALLNNIGWTYHDRSHPKEALEYFERAQAWREKQGQAPEVRIAKYAVARALRTLGRLDEALAIQQALLDELDAAGEVDGYVYEELGECLLELRRAEEATPHFAHAHEELAKDPWLADNEPDRLDRLRNLGGGA
jgi:tetratricopeptide (TPR) repeat protein